ncbi:hypothetical protein PsorP6_015710 [Peronosclerospora sorghi]|uniref:Uncharacterized protein n=1 Tax=Peronosclerospora sorghi TaxID=230839 RepID=A0ACC0WPQ1_9STRA|nr:hypothetical protein PsorP6_015710 [Peronosclerospora sorghi]
MKPLSTTKRPASTRPTRPLAVPTRKLRKSCSLSTCTSPPGTCMHCTCDGRCGRHASGRCGGRREGSGRGCKRDGCTRDDQCLHSNRATCCYCRNLVSSSGRAAKRPRETTLEPLTHVPTVYTRHGHALLPPSDDVLEAELQAFLQDANLGDELALCEYHEWTSRRHYCNLIVRVCGMQFNLHKHPVLFESGLLHRMTHARIKTEINTWTGVVPVLELAAFPGGADMFETVAIYCYTGEITFTGATFARLHCAIAFLELRDEIRQSAQRFLARHVRHPTKRVARLVQLLRDAHALAEAQRDHDAFDAACATLMEHCMAALVDETETTLDTDAMREISTLPRALLVEFTQRAMASSTTETIGPELVEEEAEHAAFHEEENSPTRSSASPFSHDVPEPCGQMLHVDALESARIKADDVTLGDDELVDLTLLVPNDPLERMKAPIDDDRSPSSTSSVDAAMFASPESCFGFGVFTCTLAETFVI